MYSFEKRQDTPLVENYLNMGEKNPSGEEIYLNNLYLTKDGKPFAPVMGEIHITRNPRSQWKDRILKMKAQGINIVSSYLIWINHEFHEGHIDFTGENDIREFIKLCAEGGMYFALRIGPWITAECRNGGLPDWLYERGIKVRENNEEYLFYVRRWYRAVYEQVKDYLYKNGGNIIMLQLDNELVKNPEHLATLKEIAMEEGITVPIYTATGWNLAGGAMLPKKEVLPMFGGYCAKPWTANIEPLDFYSHFRFSHTRNSTDIGNDLIETGEAVVNVDNSRYPYAMCELGVGLCISKHRRPYVSETDNYAFALSKLGSGCNLLGYYMTCGGVSPIIEGVTLNMDNTAFNARSNTYPIIDFGFQAGISEHGACRPTHRKLKLLNYFVNDFGAELATMQTKLGDVDFENNDTKALRYAMRTDGRRGYIFVNHHCHNLKLDPVYGVRFAVSDTLTVPETPIDVTEDDAFFLPFGIEYFGVKTEYVTAQPVCLAQNTVFSKEIGGVKPVYKFADGTTVSAEVGKDKGFCRAGVTFITLTAEEADRLYKLDGTVYIGEGRDLVIDNGRVLPTGYGEATYYRYAGGAFETLTCGENVTLATVVCKEVSDPEVDKTYQYELRKNRDYRAGKKGEYYMAGRKLKYYEISVSSPYGYVYIEYSGDSGQLYYDGEMRDDDFYNGQPWIVPAEYMYGKKVVLALAEYTHDIYVDIPPKHDLALESICVKAE